METTIAYTVYGTTTSVLIKNMEAALAGLKGGAEKTGAPENKAAKKKAPVRTETYDSAEDYVESSEDEDEIYAGADDAPVAASTKKKTKAAVVEEDEDYSDDETEETEESDDEEYTFEQVEKALLAFGRKTDSQNVRKLLSKYGMKGIKEVKGKTKYYAPIMEKLKSFKK